LAEGLTVRCPKKLSMVTASAPMPMV